MQSSRWGWSEYTCFTFFLYSERLNRIYFVEIRNITVTPKVRHSGLLQSMTAPYLGIPHLMLKYKPTGTATYNRFNLLPWYRRIPKGFFRKMIKWSYTIGNLEKNNSGNKFELFCFNLSRLSTNFIFGRKIYLTSENVFCLSSFSI